MGEFLIGLGKPLAGYVVLGIVFFVLALAARLIYRFRRWLISVVVGILGILLYLVPFFAFAGKIEVIPMALGVGVQAILAAVVSMKLFVPKQKADDPVKLDPSYYRTIFYVLSWLFMCLGFLVVKFWT